MSQARKGRRTRLEMETIYLDVMDHIVRLRADERITATLAKKYDVSPATAKNWVSEVYARHRAKADATGAHEQRRDLMRATLDTVVSMAFNKTTVLRKPDGTPMIDANTQAPIRIGSPDLGIVLQASARLCALDGLDRPREVKLSGKVDGAQTTQHTFSADDRSLLEAALRGPAKD